MQQQYVHAIYRTRAESAGKPIMWNELFKKRSRAPRASREADKAATGTAKNECPKLKRRMEKKTVQAVNENTLTISDEVDIPRDHPLVVSPEEWADAAGDSISLDEVRSALATIRGSLSEAVIDERWDR